MSSDVEWRDRINNGTIFSFDNYMYNNGQNLIRTFRIFDKVINDLNSKIRSGINPLDELKKLSNFIYLYLSSTFNASQSGSNKIIRNISDFETGEYQSRHEISGFYLLQQLENIPESIYNNRDFIIHFSTLVIIYCKWLGLHTKNIGEFIERITEIINSKTRPNYMSIECNLKEYTCGRVILPLPDSNSDSPKIIVFNTVSTDDDSLDMVFLETIFKKYNTYFNLYKPNEIHDKYPSSDTTSDDKSFLQKYLKYKKKYINLKKQINKL